MSTSGHVIYIISQLGLAQSKVFPSLLSLVRSSARVFTSINHFNSTPHYYGVRSRVLRSPQNTVASGTNRLRNRLHFAKLLDLIDYK
jgi:hypothetical protein